MVSAQEIGSRVNVVGLPSTSSHITTTGSAKNVKGFPVISPEVHVSKCVVCLVSQLEVIDKQRRECCGLAPASYRELAHPGHAPWRMLGAEDCGAEPVRVDATRIRFDVPNPGDLLAQLTWRNRRGERRGLKYVVDGRLERFVSLQGVYQLTEKSACLLAGLVADGRILN